MRFKTPKEALKFMVREQEPFIRDSVLKIMDLIDENLCLKGTNKMDLALNIFEGASKEKVRALFNESERLARKKK